MTKPLIVWAAGGVPAGANPDIVIARNGIVTQLERHELILADKGYTDGLHYFVTPLQLRDDDPRHEFFRRQMARHETINRRLKSFNVLAQRFRCADDRKHQLCFFACANLVQLQLQEDPFMEPAFL